MGKMAMLGLMVVLVYVGGTIYAEGSRNAFGGAFSFLAAGDDLPERASEAIATHKRVGKLAEDRINAGAERYEKFEP